MIHLYTNMERSLYYWLSDLFSSYSFIKVVDSFPDSDLTIPSVALTADEIQLKRLELGNRKFEDIDRMWFIDIFAENKTQRNDLAFLILDNLDNYIAVYDYNYGFPPNVSPPQIGVMIPYSLRFVPLKVFPELTDKMYWRGQIIFFTKYEQI